MTDSFEAQLAASTAPEANGIFGVSLAAIDKTGKPFYEKSAGRRSWDDFSKMVDQETTWQGFSMTKPLTTICALQCVEKGLITLDEPVGKVLPELAHPEIISAREDGSFHLCKATVQVTLRHLLTHTSGIAYDAQHPLLIQWRSSRGEAPKWNCGDVVEAYSTPLLFEPGEGWRYGGGIDWAGKVVERLNGKMRLEDYMQENLFKPLGITGTTFSLLKRPEIADRMLQLSTRKEDGSLTGPFPSPVTSNVTDDCGGIGIYSNVEDYQKVLHDLLRDEPIILGKSTVEEMFMPQFPLDSPSTKGLMDMEFMYHNLTGGVSEIGKVSWGLGGLLILGETPNHPPNTLTWGGMANLAWFLHREKGIAAIYASQMMPPNDELSAKTIGQFAQHVWKEWSKLGLS